MNNKNYAVLDIGSNSFHLVIAHFENNRIIIDQRDRVVLRLGEFTGEHGRFISPQNISNAITIIKRHKEIAAEYNCELIATATSAVREAANKNDLLDAVLQATGINIRVLSGDEEASLIYSGVMALIPANISKSFVLDIGGGSSEITLGVGKAPYKTISLKMGAVRCSSLFFPDFNLTDAAILACMDYIHRQLDELDDTCTSFHPEICIGTSGTIRIITSILSIKGLGRTSESGLPYFTWQDFQAIKDEVFYLKSNELLSRYAIEETRADILPAGLLILEGVMQKFSINEMCYSDYSLREGVILDSIE